MLKTGLSHWPMASAPEMMRTETIRQIIAYSITVTPRTSRLNRTARDERAAARRKAFMMSHAPFPSDSPAASRRGFAQLPPSRSAGAGRNASSGGLILPHASCSRMSSGTYQDNFLSQAALCAGTGAGQEKLEKWFIRDGRGIGGPARMRRAPVRTGAPALRQPAGRRGSVRPPRTARRRSSRSLRQPVSGNETLDHLLSVVD